MLTLAALLLGLILGHVSGAVVAALVIGALCARPLTPDDPEDKPDG